MIAPPIVCTSCGSKIAATRTRCLRCGAQVIRVDAAVRSRRMARAAAVLAGAAVLALAALWMTQRAAAEPPSSAVPADPFAARRPSAATPVPGASTPLAGSVTRGYFLDPAAAGAIAHEAGDYDTARERFEDAVRRNPQDTEALSNLGQMLVKLDRTAEALPYFQRACSLAPDRWTYQFNAARALGLLGRWDEAIAAYRHAQRLFPTDDVTTFNLALALHKKGDEAAAVEEYKKAIALEPNDASFHMALASSYERLHKTAEAAAAYREYLRLDASAADAERVRARLAQLEHPS